MRCKDCVYWLRDFSLPLGVGHCYAKNCITSEKEFCEVFRRKETATVAVRVLSY